MNSGLKNDRILLESHMPSQTTHEFTKTVKKKTKLEKEKKHRVMILNEENKVEEIVPNKQKQKHYYTEHEEKIRRKKKTTLNECLREVRRAKKSDILTTQAHRHT